MLQCILLAQIAWKEGPYKRKKKNEGNRNRGKKIKRKKGKRGATRGLSRRSPILVLLLPSTLNFAVLMGSDALLLV